MKEQLADMQEDAAGLGPLTAHQIAGGTATCHSLPIPLNLEILNKFLRFSWFPLRVPETKTALMVNLSWEINWPENTPMILITKECCFF